MPLAPPPKATPQRMSGGEAVPPLPLPATPLRRSEHKREPSPQKIMAKIMWGETADFKHEGGLSASVSDWNQAPADVQQILGKVRGPLMTPYTADAMNLSAFNGDPVQIPLLFFSGSRTIKFDDKQIELLRNYVMRGGVIFADAVIGSPHFYESFKTAMERAFPEQAWRTVPEDHPVYHMVTDVTTVKYPRNLKSDRPLLGDIHLLAAGRGGVEAWPGLRLGQSRAVADGGVEEQGDLLRPRVGEQNRDELHGLHRGLRERRASRPSPSCSARSMRSGRRMSSSSRRSSTRARGMRTRAGRRRCSSGCGATPR